MEINKMGSGMISGEYEKAVWLKFAYTIFHGNYYQSINFIIDRMIFLKVILKKLTMRIKMQV